MTSLLQPVRARPRTVPLARPSTRLAGRVADLGSLRRGAAGSGVPPRLAPGEAPPPSRPGTTGDSAAAVAPARVRSDSAVLAEQPARVYLILLGSWLVANAVFWSWWLQAERVESAWLYALFTLAFAYETTLLPTVFVILGGLMRRPRPLPAPAGLRVALITLCVPGAESLAVKVRQMRALAAVDYPHDSWILDEGGDPAVEAAARELGLRYFSRAGIARYNQPGPPFKAKTKAGNVNAWLDAHGAEYAYFVQLDIDHVPRPDYLDKVLGYFADPGVAWVQGPSLYGNLGNWIARGAAEQELILQGPLQQGFYGASETPFIIGSHCTYRTSAIREIGGFQPTRAEDHLDTVALAALRYRGVFVPEALAVGDGPETFEIYLRQQFAWASSLIEVLFFHAPRLLRRSRPVPALQFLFAQTWYPLWSLSMLVLFLMPMIVLVTGERPSSAPLPHFLLAWAPLNINTIAIWWWSRRWQLPAGLMLSWRGIILHVARWPIILWALLNVLLRVKHPYMITPKGDRSAPTFALRTQAIYLGAIWLTLAVVWWFLLRAPSAPTAGLATGDVAGYVPLALWGAVFMLVVVATNVIGYLVDLRRLGLGARRRARLALAPLAILVTTVGAFGATVTVDGYQSVAAAELAAGPLSVLGYPAAGALGGRAIVPPAAGDPAADAAAGVVSQSPGGPLAVEAGLPATAAPPALAAPPASPPAPGPIANATATPTAPPPTALAHGLPADRLAVGAYDPQGAFAGMPLDLEHRYVRQDEPARLVEALNGVGDGRTALITVEPYGAPGAEERALEAVAAGERDAEIAWLARIVRSEAPRVVLVRWGHEMELHDLYPWSARDPAAYRAAYRRVVEVFRREGASNVRWVWSPAGNPEAPPYYPGDDVVDYVGLTILGDEQWDQQFGLPPQTFAQLLRPKYAVVAPYAKPVLIAELGVSGTAERRAAWLREVPSALDAFPLVRAVSYFNSVNAPNNRLARQPDWRIGRALFGAVADRLGRIARQA